MTEEEQSQAWQRGKGSAGKLRELQQEGGLRPDFDKALLNYVDTRDAMHQLAEEGSEEAARQEAYLNGWLSVWD